MALRIPLRGKLFAVVDDEDIERICLFDWRPVANGRGYYARTGGRVIPSHHKLLHRLILKVSHNEAVDHINGDGLDNRRCNLRVASASQNGANRGIPDVEKTSRFKGVHYNEAVKRWCARIGYQGTHIGLGAFDNELEAARAYDEAAKQHFGQFAMTNQMMGLFEPTRFHIPSIPDVALGRVALEDDGEPRKRSKNRRKRRQNRQRRYTPA